jgi:hypothetical protein
MLLLRIRIRCDFSGWELSMPSSCTFYFFALKSSFCYPCGCNPHPGGILRSKANAPRALKLVFLPMNILVSFDAENITQVGEIINHKLLLFTNKCWSSQVVVLQCFEMIRWEESLFKLNWFRAIIVNPSFSHNSQLSFIHLWFKSVMFDFQMRVFLEMTF